MRGLQALLGCMTYMLIMDAVWIGNVALPLYQRTLKAGVTQNNTVNIAIAAVLVYGVIVLGLMVFAASLVRESSWLSDSLFWGGLYGLVTYTIFSGTNLAIFQDWTLLLLATDSLWGVVLCASSLSIYHAILYR